MRAMLLTAVCLLSACSVIIERRETVVTYSSVDVARDWLGTHQSYDRSALREFLGVDPVRTEWCAAFVNSVLAQAGIPGSDSVHRYPLLARSFLDWGQTVELDQLVTGDVVVFTRGTQGWQGHVGFYMYTVWDNGVQHFAILGGNQDNSVSIELYPVRRVLGARRWNEIDI